MTTQPTATEPQRLQEVLNGILFGKPELTAMTTAAFFAGGHVLLEGLPGLGKTVLAKSMAAATGLDYKRIQFTPDLMPADITGTHLLEDGPEGKRLRFVPGPVFTHFLLADEINRASPKTQAALLEAMGEGSVTHMGQSRTLEAPFFVIATQNPIEMEGTNPLPEAQLDRFAIKLMVAATDEASLLRIISERREGSPPTPEAVLDRAAVLRCREAIEQVFLPEPVAVMISRLVARANPEHPDAGEAVKKHVRYGPSARAAIWLTRMARALAFIEGRQGVGFEDVRSAAPHVLRHRLILSYGARLDSVTAESLIAELVETTEKDVLGGQDHGSA
ncbi:MAG: MoxR family ATPase [Myxococcales bacterium]|nr:MoxR family ATPase [Myxococcales bacterium]